LAGDERGVTGRLPQSEERLQGRENAPAFLELRDDVLKRRGTHGVVDLALRFAELAVEDRIRARRKLGGHVLLEAAEHERPDALAKACRDAVDAFRHRLRVAILEIAAPAEQASIQEVHLAPQLVEAVFNRRPRKRQAPSRFHPVRGLEPPETRGS
jgi:hypothetical protein